MEIWKDIVGYEGLYMVSSLGRIKSLRFNRERVMKPVPNSSGYLQVSFKGAKYLVNRIVCTAFHPNPENKAHVNHLDETPSNNAASNLEWATASENQLYSKKRIGEDCYKATITEHTALRIFKLTKKYSVKKISDRLHISSSIVRKIKKGEAWNQVTGLPRKRFYKFSKQLKTAA
jgi:hypothetical protein